MVTPDNNLPATAERSSAQAIKERVKDIQDILRIGMREGQDYGTIPGCGDKKTLYKSGAEKILFTFRLAPKLIVEDLSVPGTFRYRVKTEIREYGGTFIGDGIGEASTDEEKYAWRAALCDAEFDNTPETLRRIKYKNEYIHGVKQPIPIKQVHTNPADHANTVLKMAKKRSMVDAALTATGASEVFSHEGEPDPTDGSGSNGTGNAGDPLSVVINFGKFKGKAIGFVLENEKKYLEWLADKATTPSVKNAAAEALRMSDNPEVGEVGEAQEEEMQVPEDLDGADLGDAPF